MENGSRELETVKSDVIAGHAGIPSPSEVNFDSHMVEKKMTAITQAMDACTKISLQRTNPTDWVKMGKGFYLTDAGAMKVRAIWGIYFRNIQMASEKKEDGNIAYTVTGEVGSKLLDNWYGSEVIVECMGSRSSADGFFGANPDQEDVKKAAIANFRARAVVSVLGISNMTEDDLKKNGLDIQKIPSVEFKKGSKGGSTVSPEDKEIQVKLYNLLVKALNTSEEAVLSKELELITSFTAKDGAAVGGVKSLKALTGKRLQVTYGKAKQKYPGANGDTVKKINGEEEIQIDQQ